MEMKVLINEINRLARKKRTISLTDSELATQQEYYKEYLSYIRAQVKQKLDTVKIIDSESFSSPIGKLH